MSFEEEMEELESAEDFLQYFQSVVHVNRLHILQRFQKKKKKASDEMPNYEPAKRAIYRKLLDRAYQDFVTSDAQTEKVFKVFSMSEPQSAFVALGDIKV